MAEIKRKYVVPLRKEFQKVPRYKKAKKAITALKQFLVKHMKSENVKIGTKANELIWQNGIKNPPAKIELDVVKKTDGTVQAELVGHKFIEKKKVEKKEKGKMEALAEKLAGKKSADDVPALKKKEEKEKKQAKKEAPKVEPEAKEEPKVTPEPAKEVSETDKVSDDAQKSPISDKPQPKVEEPKAPVEKPEVKEEPSEKKE